MITYLILGVISACIGFTFIRLRNWRVHREWMFRNYFWNSGIPLGFMLRMIFVRGTVYCSCYFLLLTFPSLLLLFSSLFFSFLFFRSLSLPLDELQQRGSESWPLLALSHIQRHRRRNNHPMELENKHSRATIYTPGWQVWQRRRVFFRILSNNAMIIYFAKMNRWMK